ncbi:hypothetical protein FHS43_002243 [Streptosporangium becharense]|uniref:CU044_5270 family protein n=1 Tax=Streptosporangium becharense TaxID=1816182 RepID=A0A7W9IKX1_9ACTN|nr:CU044_5270 family protein [Streptosporangium becharense]MBB2910978.1 hypothetical protein [Streptosporangium becharense]MBB5821964.1 hypothetical protein [Streptosporangium becharense]
MNDIDDRVRALRPDNLMEETYRSRRDADLTRAFAETAPSRPAARFRLAVPRLSLVPRLLVAGALAAAAAAVVVPATMTGTTAQPGPGADPVPAVAAPSRSTAAPVELTAGTFLLAGAETAAREPADTGRYWFERTRTFEPVGSGAVVAHTGEIWYNGRDGRSSSNLDVKVTFADEADEAAWREKGSPRLWEAPKTEDFSKISLQTKLGKQTLTLNDERKLPGDAAELERWLRAAHEDGPFGEFVFTAARHILSSPASPATRSAMLRVLAAQPGLKLEQGVTDPLGRPGVAVTTADGHHRLIVDESGARLLAFEYDGPDQEGRTAERAVGLPLPKGMKVAYESSGWVQELGARK